MAANSSIVIQVNVALTDNKMPRGQTGSSNDVHVLPCRMAGRTDIWRFAEVSQTWKLNVRIEVRTGGMVQSEI